MTDDFWGFLLSQIKCLAQKPSIVSFSLQIEGNLMEDRYRSILKRNIVEVRNPKRNKGRKYKLKKYQKPGVDEVTVDYVPR
uniref:Uncharacterized protein n=1 Tax=Romanomermis culicivorax TaxID=13658 RepID=A0A915ITH5_ROMCU